MKPKPTPEPSAAAGECTADALRTVRLEDVEKPRSWKIVETRGEGADRVHLVKAGKRWYAVHDIAEKCLGSLGSVSILYFTAGGFQGMGEDSARALVNILEPLSVVRCSTTGMVLGWRDFGAHVD